MPEPLTYGECFDVTPLRPSMVLDILFAIPRSEVPGVKFRKRKTRRLRIFVGCQPIYGHFMAGWWFGCHFLFSHILGIIIIPIDFHIFHRGSNHQPDGIELGYTVMGYVQLQYFIFCYTWDINGWFPSLYWPAAGSGYCIMSCNQVKQETLGSF